MEKRRFRGTDDLLVDLFSPKQQNLRDYNTQKSSPTKPPLLKIIKFAITLNRLQDFGAFSFVVSKLNGKILWYNFVFCFEKSGCLG